MFQGCRLRNISILAVIFLAFYNIILTLKYLYIPECKTDVPILYKSSPKAPNCNAQKEIISNEIDSVRKKLSVGRWDNKHLYILHDNVIVGDKFLELSNIYQVSLATQSSLDKIASLIEVANYWNGPISLATFAASDEELSSLLCFIEYLRMCHIAIRERVTFHFAFPKDRRPKTIHVNHEGIESMDCDTPLQVVKQLTRPILKGFKLRTKLPYPQNHLRNLARKNCQTKYVFLTDVDIIPCSELAEKLDQFLGKTTCAGQCAYVIPTYEIDERVLLPYNKSELIRLVNKGLARPFHHKVFIYNQYATNFTKWQNQVNEPSEVHISHPVTNFEFLYEPFYVALDTVPAHDERFIGYGYTRNTQVYEMFVAGYEFLVLSPIFTYHWGLQLKKFRPPWREHQNSLNRKHFDTFKKEVFARYNKDPLNMMVAKHI